MSRVSRTKSISAEEIKQRGAAARVFLEAAEMYLDVAHGQTAPSAQAQVAASNAIDAGIAAADAICGHRLGKRSNSQDHQSAADLLREAGAEGREAAVDLSRLLHDKSATQYGGWSTFRNAEDAVRRARKLIEAMDRVLAS